MAPNVHPGTPEPTATVHEVMTNKLSESDYDDPDDDLIDDDTDADSDQPRGRRPGAVRSTDLEPYTGLRWVSTLFKAAAVFVFVALAAEFIAGLRMAGTTALPSLLGETAQTVVLAVVLWGGGDLVRLLVDMGHDLRAERILMVRLLSRTPKRTMPDGALDRSVDEEAEELNIHRDEGGAAVPTTSSGTQSAALEA